MTDWTPEQLRAMGYELDPDNPKNVSERGRIPGQIASNAAHREGLLPSSRSAGEPLAEKETPPPRTERQRLFKVDPDEYALNVLRAKLGISQP